MKPFRVGLGEDIHRFEVGRRLILGTVEIPFEKGLLGHSDADVVLHALADSILSAIGESDIGAFFPNNDPSIEGIDSKEIVDFAKNKAELHGYSIGNTSISILAERPKLRPHIQKMKEGIALLLGIDVDEVGIAAGTNEGIDGVGHMEGIKATAVTLLVRKE